ncbi:type IV pili twitching motility protein PilT [Acidihalobacter yilgarnensis]|uniref:Type IV pili twitching motility protein PilT n=1 Tax=Acidihalobacter yilgarnensis TaxID=2819280 RepID=A0A1D8IKB1_9GAMM|nr:PilT/PilU family type 4a pilus ATPase [Acidihalobacter yilgarnensis]AOU96831.1 type IV pili twitching motility protein PilT [Acidihalobacter yilgarnensis]
MKLEPYFRLMAEHGASDLYFTTGAPVSVRIEGDMRAVGKDPLGPGVAKRLVYEVLGDEQVATFEAEKELNLGISLPEIGRFRLNVYYQRGEVSMVVRYIKSVIPSIEQLNLPPVLKDLVSYPSGLVLVVGSTGSGKSTTLASMVDYRNITRADHILTIEDPIEYVFTHKRSIVGQREVGLDTWSYGNALREAMREAPDLIMIGEIRDRTTMEAAIAYADTGHLCLSTLHAINANQALERVINFFPAEAKQQILMDLSLNLRGIVSQRLVATKASSRIPAVEVLVNTSYAGELIQKGDFRALKDVMEKGVTSGMQTFDQSLYELYRSGKITLKDAMDHADSRGDLEWRVNFGGGMKALKKTKDTLAFPSDVIDEPSALDDLQSPGE